MKTKELLERLAKAPEHAIELMGIKGEDPWEFTIVTPFNINDYQRYRLPTRREWLNNSPIPSYWANRLKEIWPNYWLNHEVEKEFFLTRPCDEDNTRFSTSSWHDTKEGGALWCRVYYAWIGETSFVNSKASKYPTAPNEEDDMYEADNSTDAEKVETYIQHLCDGKPEYEHKNIKKRFYNVSNAYQRLRKRR